MHGHHAALFVGNTHTYDDEDGLTIGVEYEYRVMPEFGVGALVEYADVHDVWVVGMPFVLHPHAGWNFVAMPGAEIGKLQLKLPKSARAEADKLVSVVDFELSQWRADRSDQRLRDLEEQQMSSL